MQILLKRISVPGNPDYQKLDSQGFLSPLKSLLFPDAADAYLKFLDYMDRQGLHPLANDMFRSPQEQIDIKKAKPTVAYLPGQSGHNWGISVDISTSKLIDEAFHLGKPYSVDTLRTDMSKFGWTPSPKEAWHFNYLQGCLGIQDWVNKNYGMEWDSSDDLTPIELQGALAQLGFYTSVIDGVVGPQTQAAIKSFQFAYLLPVDGQIGPMTRKVLLISIADLKIL